jgi:hypothetical protein
MIGRLPYRGIVDRILVIVQGFSGILDGAVMVCTLGFYGSRFELNVARYRAWRMICHKPVTRAKIETLR